MSNVVNLRQARKTKVRHEKEVVAEANRAKHGISKSAHKKAKIMAVHHHNRLEGHKLDSD
jgi:hypothetical protein